MRQALSIAVLLFLSACSSTPVADNKSLKPSGSEIDDLAVAASTAHHLAKTHGAASVLVVFDIDNTLLAATETLGSDQWFDWQDKKAPAGEKITDDFGCLLRAQGILYHLGSMRGTQNDVATVISGLQVDGFPAMALTSRGVEFRLQTHREFRRNGVSFTKRRSAVSAEDVGVYKPYDAKNVVGFTSQEITKFELDDKRGKPRPVRYEEGVYFTAGQHKGAMLRLLLTKLGATNKIKAIVFVDDKNDHVVGMKEAYANRGVDVYAYRFTAEDQSVADFINDVGGQRLAAKSAWCKVSATLKDLAAASGDANIPVDGKCPDLHRNICATP